MALHRIYETFTDDEWEALQKAKGKKTWHDFIINCAGIDVEAIKNLCLDFDLSYGKDPEDEYEGFALLNFFFEKTTEIEYPCDLLANYDELLVERRKEKNK